LFCDPEGIYLKDLNLIDCMSNYQKRLMQKSGDSFEKFQAEFADHASKAFNGNRQR
jgi:hypothetical protein